MRRVHFCSTQLRADMMAKAESGMLLTGAQHPEKNHQALRDFMDGKCKLLVADWSMATGWRVVGEDIRLTFDEDFPKGNIRLQAEARVHNPNLFL